MAICSRIRGTNVELKCSIEVSCVCSVANPQAYTPHAIPHGWYGVSDNDLPTQVHVGLVVDIGRLLAIRQSQSASINSRT